MTIDQKNADRAATELLVEIGARPPIYTYELLHGIVAAAWLVGVQRGLREGREMLREVVEDTDALDPSDPKHPAYGDNLRDYADRSRKADKENRA